MYSCLYTFGTFYTFIFAINIIIHSLSIIKFKKSECLILTDLIIPVIKHVSLNKPRFLSSVTKILRLPDKTITVKRKP